MAERRVVKGWIVERGDDGVIRPIAPAGGGGQMPTDPTFETKRPQALADLGKTTATTTNTNANTNRTVVQTRGDQLDNAGKARTLTQNPISEKDQAMINAMRLNQGDLPGVLRDITGAQAAVDRFQPSPGKGALYSLGVPEDDDWAITAGLKNLVGLALPEQGKQDYQTLRGLQNQGVLNAQLAQKGPQTESDAARMKLVGVSPNKATGTNAQLLAEQQYDTMMKNQRPAFFEYWANKLGSTHALNGARKSADQVWTEQYQRGLQQMRNGPGYRAAQGRPTAAPRKQPQARFLGWEK